MLINNFDRITRSEAKASQHINIVGHYKKGTLIDRDGKLINIIKLAGIDSITKSDAILDVYKNRRNSLFKGFSSEFALYFWTIRKKTAEFPAGHFDNCFANHLNEKYKNKIKQQELYFSNLYLGIITKQPEGVINKGISLFKQFSYHADKAAKQEYHIRRYEELEEITAKVLNTLKDYQPELLSVYHDNNIYYSEALEFISQLLNFDQQRVPLKIAKTASYLPRKRLFFNRRSGTIEFRTNQNSRFAAILSIKEYAPVTYQGILDDLAHLRIEYIITQSYRFYDRHYSKKKMRGQQKDMAQSKEESLRQTDQIDEAFDEAASGELGYGAHHFCLICFANNQAELNSYVAEIIAKFSDLDIVCIREDIISESCYWAQLPGNFGYIARQADISTKNMAAFASLHNNSKGQITGNYWGNAVTVLETITGSPYYFNFHHKDIGNFIIVGAMGSGKTVLVGFLIAQSLKFGGKRIIFDKDRGLEILVRALDGNYEMIKPGIATGFNPCQLDNTAENKQFLCQLLKKILKPYDRSINEEESKIIDSAIEGLYRLEKQERKFVNLAPYFGANKKFSLRARFDKWHSQGEYAWLFDNSIDSFDYSCDVTGIDLGAILKEEECKTPTLMYLMFRFSQIIEGKRGLIFIDEGWAALQDDYFKNIINEQSRTPRKKNNIFGLATQAGTDTAKSAINAPINEAAACKIFFPNPMADKDIYITEFGLSEREFELIKSLPDDKNFFLLNYAKGKESVVVRANLQGLEDEIAVISGRKSTVDLLDKIRAEFGDNPEIWLPIFHERRRMEPRS